MKEEHIKYLRCPKNKRQLELIDDSIELENGKIKNGILVEPYSGNKYPIVNFIPRFVPQENYAANFGVEWNRHHRTQYDESSGLSMSKERFAKETKWGEILEGELILEVGSGSGRFTTHAVETRAMIISLDYSNAVDANYKSNGHHENLLIIQASVYEMPFENEYFDRVFCFGVLQHTPDPRRSFAHLVQSIKQGGYISTDIYLKTFSQTVLTPKYLIRRYTRQLEPEKLYTVVEKYVNFMWPLVKIIRRIPKIGKSINWRLMIADYYHLDKNLEDKKLKDMAILDSYDMLSPMYDYPQTKKTFFKWHKEEDLNNIEVQYGYNGIEGRGQKNK